MFFRAVICLVIAIAAALYGFGGWQGPVVVLARAVFGVSLILFLALLLLWHLPPPR